MDAQEPKKFKHTTLDAYPAKLAGITFLDEAPGFTGIYLHDADGGLWPARTVDRSDARHHESVLAAWTSDSRYGEVVDRRAVRGRPPRQPRVPEGADCGAEGADDAARCNRCAACIKEIP